MNYKLLSVHRKDASETNIGDYIQALAASQFLPSVDGFINREELKSYNEEVCKVIMNGWFMHNSKEWPPSKKITPLFISFHINKSASDFILSEKGIDYLKQHEPIGCRDFYTRDLLLKNGIKAYFSGCLTLSLGLKYSSKERNGGCYVVDPIIPEGKNVLSLIKDLFFLLNNYNISKITSKKLFSYTSIRYRLKTCRFLRLYSAVFNLESLVNATYIKQQTEYYTARYKSDFELLKEAERLVGLYSQAQMVITSRIHCALPCLGLDTPVYFIHRRDGSEISSCRFGGLMELFNSIEITNKSIIPDFIMDKNKLSINNVIENPTAWKRYADEIIMKCKNFISAENE